MRKLIKACVALAAFAAFAVAPGTASATNDPQLTAPAGTLLAVGSSITGTNVGETLMTDGSGNILTRCTTAVMKGTVAANSGGTVSGNITSAEFGGSGTKAAGATEPECTGSFGNITVTASTATNGLPWCLTSNSTMTTHEVRIRGNGCSSASRPIRFVLHSTTVGECTYERTGALAGTYTTGTVESARVSISKVEFPKVAGGFLCPSAGFLDMTFTLETGTNPVYIS